VFKLVLTSNLHRPLVAATWTVINISIFRALWLLIATCRDQTMMTGRPQATNTDVKRQTRLPVWWYITDSIGMTTLRVRDNLHLEGCWQITKILKQKSQEHERINQRYSTCVLRAQFGSRKKRFPWSKRFQWWIYNMSVWFHYTIKMLHSLYRFTLFILHLSLFLGTLGKTIDLIRVAFLIGWQTLEVIQIIRA
jgi:hypothetical protein